MNVMRGHTGSVPVCMKKHAAYRKTLTFVTTSTLQDLPSSLLFELPFSSSLDSLSMSFACPSGAAFTRLREITCKKAMYSPK